MESQQNTILGIVAIVISVGTTIIGIINHKKLRSKCCSRKIEIEFDIESTRHPITSNPMPHPSPKPSAASAPV